MTPVSGPAALVSREEARRRVLLLAIGALLVLSVAPVFGHHLAVGLEHGFHNRDHLGPICLIALHEMMEPVHYLFHGLVLVGVLYAVVERARAVARVRQALAPLEVRHPRQGDPFWVAAAAADIAPERVCVVDGLPNPAFTAGWIRPRIYIAREVAERLSADELAALLAHEAAHVVRRDPLRLSVLRFLASTLFWIPALRRLEADVADEAEIQADDRAAGQPLVLASALLSLAQWRPAASPIHDVVGFSQRTGLLERRVRRLTGEDVVAVSHVTRASIAAALVALALVWGSGAVMAHPLPVQEDGRLAHCDHPGESPLTHLACAATRRTDGDSCPHTKVASGGAVLLVTGNGL